MSTPPYGSTVDLSAFVFDLLLAVLTAVVGALAIYGIFRPRLKFGDGIRREVKPWRPERVHEVVYRNAGPFTAYDVEVQVWIRAKARPDDDTWQIIPVPLTTPSRPILHRSRRKEIWTLPELNLEAVDWNRNFPPERRPNDPLDLRAVLEFLDATLFVTIAATTGFGGIRRVRRKTYLAQNILDAE